jgi:integrase
VCVETTISSRPSFRASQSLLRSCARQGCKTCPLTATTNPTITAARFCRLPRLGRCKKLDSGLAPRTVQYIHATLHKALDQAVKWRLIPYNVSDAVTRPRQKRSERDALTLRQALDFFEVAKGDRFEALYGLAVFTGMRPGEMLALRWPDLVLDTPEPVARVRRSLSKDDGGRLVVKSTKTEKGRAIALLPQVVEALQTHRKRQAEHRLKYSGLWRNENLVFPSKTGGPMSWDNLVRRNLKPLMRAAGLPETTRPYDLRHTFATLMLEQGENPKVVQEVLGHSSIKTTMDTYSHVIPGMQEEAAGRLQRLLFGSTPVALPSEEEYAEKNEGSG